MPRRMRRVCGVRVGSPARWLPPRGQRLPSESCGGTAMRPHTTLRLRLTSHASAPSPSRSHLLFCTAVTGRTHSHFQLSKEKERGEGDGEGGRIDCARDRRWCSPERSGSPERLRVEGTARCTPRNPFLHFLPFPPCSIPRSRFVEIQAIRRCVGVPAGAEVVC